LAALIPLARFTPRVGGGSGHHTHIYGKIITEVSLSELPRDEVSPRSVYGRQQARAKLDASKEQGIKLGHDIFYLS
jgi:hypothetical protein